MNLASLKSRASSVGIFVYLAFLLPIPLLFISLYLRLRGFHWNWKYGSSEQQPDGQNKKTGTPKRYPFGAFRDIIDLFAIMWRNPEMPHADMYQPLETDRLRSERFYTTWADIFLNVLSDGYRALAVLQRGLKIYPDSTSIRFEMVKVLLTMEMWPELAEAAAVLCRTTSGRRQYKALECLGYAQCRLEDYSAAAQAYQAALLLKPDSEKISSALHACQEQQEQLDRCSSSAPQ